MKRITSIAVAMVGLLAFADPVGGQSAESRVPPNRPPKPDARNDVPLGQLRVVGRIYVGDGVPDFTALSSSGRQITVSRLKGEWLVLLFVAAREDFRKFRQIHEDLRLAGATVYGVCKEKPQRLRAIVERDSLPFDLLADDTGDISSIYGLYDLHRRSTTPGFVLVDRQGVVRMALQGLAPPEQVAALTHFTIGL